MKRARHRIVLIAGDNRAAAGRNKRFDGDIQAVRRIGREYDLLGRRHMKQLSGQRPAAERSLLRPPRRFVSAAPR